MFTSSNKWRRRPPSAVLSYYFAAFNGASKCRIKIDASNPALTCLNLLELVRVFWQLLIYHFYDYGYWSRPFLHTGTATFGSSGNWAWSLSRQFCCNCKLTPRPLRERNRVTGVGITFSARVFPLYGVAFCAKLGLPREIQSRSNGRELPTNFGSCKKLIRSLIRFLWDPYKKS